MKRTNYFGRFENKPANAEDRLTRTFLVLLRLIPPVQAAFIDAIRGTHQEEGNDSVVPSRTVTDECVSGVWSQVGTLRTDEGRVLSILSMGFVKKAIFPCRKTRRFTKTAQGRGYDLALNAALLPPRSSVTFLKSMILRSHERPPIGIMHMFRSERVVFGSIRGPDGEDATVRTVWMIEEEQPDAPRFVTAYPA